MLRFRFASFQTSRLHLPVSAPFAALFPPPGFCSSGPLVGPRYGSDQGSLPSLGPSPTSWQQRWYYGGSDSSSRHPANRSPRFLRPSFPSFRPQPRGVPRCRFPRHPSATGSFRASPSPSRLAAAPRRIRFVFLRTDSSPPVALHPASRRRSNLRLRGCGKPRRGLPPRWIETIVSR